MQKNVQKVRYLKTPDGVRLAWAESGSGKPLLKAANWMTHLEYDWESPVWRHWMEFFSANFRFIRHDERGCGMTDRRAGDLTLDRWIDDVGSVAEAAEPGEPIALLGISQGAAACIGYAARYPERVSHLIIYGGYARGTYERENDDKIRLYRALIELVKQGWGSENPAFRSVFTSRFVPGASDEQLGWFNELCRKTTDAETAALLMEARARINVLPLLEQIKTQTLVMHSREDDVIPIEEGHILAAGINGAEFIELESKNHVLLEHEPAWTRFCDEILRFTGVVNNETAEHEAFAELTAREREILSQLAEGFGNAQIASRLEISEKTVRNHVSKVFDKLGVSTRAQAIVFARDRGFRG